MKRARWLLRLPYAVVTAGVLMIPPIAAAQSAAPSGGTMVPVASTDAAPKVSTAKLPKTDEFKTVADATAHCPGGIVVWSSLSKSRSFHLSGSRYYGTTKHGAYVCKSDALAFGFHQARS